MIILSSFNSDYLRDPLQFLIDQFIDDEKIEINYGNVIASLLDIKKVQASRSITVLFRLIDLVHYDGKTIDIPQLQRNLKLLIDTIDSVKNRLAVHFIVVLCPSLEYGLPDLQFLEMSFYNSMQNKAIALVKMADIQAYYSLSTIENKVGKDTHIPYTPRFYTALACFLARKLHNLISKPYKVIVADCDDTLWEGVVGDIGVENISFSKHNLLLQAFLVKKYAEGMLICLCSKNDKQNVMDVFDKRRNDMLLTLEHVSKIKINWQLKSENIARLAEDLNLGLDSFIFIDDSSFEIEEVGRNFPEVLCIKAPQNTEEFFSTKDNWAFDYRFLTDEDKNRSRFYKEDENRQRCQSTFTNYIQFLQSTHLSILIDEVQDNQEEAIKRISALSGKTNQFNLFPLAKDIAEVKNSLKDGKVVFSVKARDDFGDYGLIAVAFCHVQDNVFSVDSFFVSCRAFKKGIEYHLLKYIAQYTVDKSLDRINLCFKRTEKNTVAQRFVNLLLQKFSDSCGDITQLDLGKETSISFLSAQLALLEVNNLLEIQNNVQIDPIVTKVKKNISGNYFNNKNYLLKLQRITQALDFILDKFFFNEEKLLNLPTLEAKIFTLCNFLLGDIQKDVALIYLGLDSLKASELSYYLYQITRVNVPITVLLSKTTTVPILVAYFEKQKCNDHKLDVLIASTARQTMDVSSQQKRVWFAEKKEINHDNPSSNYMMVACFSIKKLCISRFKAACWQLIKKHEAFGCSFFMQDKELVQTILPIEDRQLAFETYSIPAELSAKAFILNEAKKSFLMHEMPLIRFSVFVIEGGSKFYILIRIHHGIFDAISLQNALAELSDLYKEKNINAGLNNFPEYQYSNFIHHQRFFYKTESYQKEATNYWSNILSCLKLTTEFPYDKASTSLFNPILEQPCGRYNFSIPQKSFLALQQLAQYTQTTIFNLTISLFSILVSAYTYEDKVGIITATTGRNAPMFHKIIGFFVNLMVLPFDLQENISFFDYAKANYQVFLDSIVFQDFSFEKVQEITKKQGINNILVNPALIYQSYKAAELILDDEKAILEIPEKPILYDLREICRFGAFTLFVQESNKGLDCLIEYSQLLYSDDFIERIANNLLYLVDNVCKNAHQKLHTIGCVSEKEEAELLNFSKGPLCPYPEKEGLISFFQRQVFHYPDSIAIAHNDVQLTYRELDDLSTYLANDLAHKGIRVDEIVGLYFNSTYLFFIAELALLKLGAVFVPLSKTDPDERLNFIIQNAKITYIIFDITFPAEFESQVQLIKISKRMFEKEVVLRKETYPVDHASLDSRACILYTSGSTGTPKGVILNQRGIVRVVKSAGYIHIDNQDRVLQAANLAFDAAQLECWLAWTNGACLVVTDKEVLLNFKLFEEKLFAEKVTVLWLTAALFHQYAYINPAIFRNVKYLLAGGDIVEKKALQEVFYCEDNKAIKLIVGYGPTETSIFATICKITPDIFNDFLSIPIGNPINNTEIRLLDRFKNLAPMGAKAQLAIGGDSLTEGYLNNSDLQKERFIICPKLLSSTLYLSGDQVRISRMTNPQLLFCGRLDSEQLKREGFLVSLPEIESVLMRHRALKQVAVIIKSLSTSKKQLIAFYIRNENDFILDDEHFSDYLKDKLPPYMLPDFYQELEEFPITPNGKLDKKALLQLEINVLKSNSGEFFTDSQQRIADLFKNILSLPSDSEYKLSLDDNFFNCGGTSILAVQLIYEIEQQFGIRLSFNVLRQNSSIRSLDRILKSQVVSTKLEVDSSFIKLKIGDEKLPPIGFMHPAGGALYCYEPLIKKTLLNHSFFGIEDPVLSHGLQQNLSFKEMAKSYLLQIEEKIKQPFILSGYSFGGMLALEIAAQLEERQENNLIGVILIDTWVVSCASEHIKSQLKEEVLNYYSEVSRKISKTGNQLADQLKQRYRYLQEMGFAFKPRKLRNTRVTLLKATALGSSFEHMAVESKNNYLLDFVSENLFCCTYIPGNHYSILEEECIDSTAKVFSEQVIRLQTAKLNTVKVKNISAQFFSDEKNYNTITTKSVADTNHKPLIN